MGHEDILDEMAIRSLVTKERYYRDSAQFDALRACYHPDASQTFIDITWYQGDINGFVAGSRKMAEQGGGAIHTTSPVEITMNGGKAVSVSVGSIISRFTKEDVDYDLVSHCRFISRLERIGDGEKGCWKMLSMEVIYVHDSISRAIPTELEAPFHAVRENHKGTRDSYKCLAFVLGQKDYRVKDSLPGTDDQDTVKAVLQRNSSWLNE